MATLFDPIDERHSFNVVTSKEKQKPEQEVVFPDADKKDTACTIVYTEDGQKIFFDPEFKNEITDAKQIMSLFMTGVICKKGETYYTAKSLSGSTINFGF